MAKQESPAYRPFPVTQWSLIARAAHVDAETRRRALSELLERYVPAVKCYLTLGKRIDPDRADDILQGFLASKILDEHLIERADQQRGKFRTFLLTALDRFIINQHRFDAAQKRSPAQLASIDDQPEPAESNNNPANTFDVAWARQVLDRTIARMNQECKGSGRLDLWDVFQARVLGPTLGQSAAVPYDDLVSRAGFSSPVQAANALVTAKRMFARILRTVISEYEGSDAEIEDELNDLHEILAQKLAQDPRRMESEPDTIAIHTADARDLAKLFDPGNDTPTIYHGADPAVILRHQLEAPLADELSSPIAGPQSEPLVPDPRIKTFADLFSDENPPIELLKRAKDFAKACRTNPELLPPPVATVLYYSAIITARLRLKTSITQLADEDLRAGLQWAIAQVWVDEKTKDLFRAGLERI